MILIYDIHIVLHSTFTEESTNRIYRFLVFFYTITNLKSFEAYQRKSPLNKNYLCYTNIFYTEKSFILIFLIHMCALI